MFVRKYVSPVQQANFKQKGTPIRNVVGNYDQARFGNHIKSCSVVWSFFLTYFNEERFSAAMSFGKIED